MARSDHDPIRLDRPARPRRLRIQLPLPVGRERAGKGVAVPHVLLPLRPLEGLVGRRAAVDEVRRVGEEAPDERGGEHGEEGDGADARVPADPQGPDAEVGVPRHAAGPPDGPLRIDGLLELREDGEAQEGGVGGDDGRGEEQEDEPVVVAVPHARVDEDAVVVGPGDAALADAAMLGPRGLD